MNLIFVSSACFLFDYSMKSISYIFNPNFEEELQMVYNRYIPINSTKQLSDRLQKNNFDENIVIEDKIIKEENLHIKIKKSLKNKKYRNS